MLAVVLHGHSVALHSQSSTVLCASRHAHVQHAAIDGLQILLYAQHGTYSIHFHVGVKVMCVALEHGMIVDHHGYVQIAWWRIWHVSLALPLVAHASSILDTSWDVNCDAGVVAMCIKAHGHALASKRIFQADVEVELVVPVARLLPSEWMSTTKELVEHLFKWLPAKAEMELLSWETMRLSKRISLASASKLALLVIVSTLLRIAQRVVSFVDLLEQRF